MDQNTPIRSQATIRVLQYLLSQDGKATVEDLKAKFGLHPLIGIYHRHLGDYTDRDPRSGTASTFTLNEVGLKKAREHTL